MVDPSAPCKRDYTAAHKSGIRRWHDIKWIVLHSTEGDTAESAARWFSSVASNGSAHLVVDDNVCFRTLRNTDIPWAAPGANTYGFHIEQAGHAAWSDMRWREHDATIRRAAYKTAYHAQLFKIPLRWVGPIGLKLGRRGITTHADCTKAFGGDHTDPGLGYPKALFMQYAKAYAKQLRAR